MKINFNMELKDFDGVALLEAGKAGEPPKPLTLKSAAINALMSMDQSEVQGGMSSAEKLDLYQLAQKVHGGEEEFTVDELAKIKSRVGKFMITAVTGAAFAAIEGAGA